MRRRLPMFAALLFPLASCSGRSGEVGDAVDQYVAGLMSRRKVPGLALAIVENGKVAKMRCYGLADIEREIPATEATLFPLRSLTKPFTAVAVMMLVEEGKLSLTDEAVAILPDLPVAWEGVTVEHLLTHTSGLPDVSVDDNAISARYLEANREAALRRVASLPVLNKPGESYRYTETNYVLLGMIVERETGQSFPGFMAARIFRPLGMDATRYGELEEASGGKTTYYTDARILEKEEIEDLGRAEAIKDEVPAYDFPGAGLNATVADMAKWDAAIDAGRLLKPSSLETLWTPTPHSVRLRGDAQDGYGCGWAIHERSGHKEVGMYGGGSAGYWRYLDDRLAIIVLTNCRGAFQGGPVFEDILKAYRSMVTPNPK